MLAPPPATVGVKKLQVVDKQTKEERKCERKKKKIIQPCITKVSFDQHGI